MTVIARFTLDNKIPVLIGDMLVSAEGAKAPLTRVPTASFLTSDALFPATTLPCQLTQKIALFGNDVAIAWAGIYSDAEDVITTLYATYKNGDLTFDELCHILKAKEADAAFLGFYRQPDGSHLHFSYCDPENVSHYRSPYEHLFIIGSGTNALHKWLANSNQIYRQTSENKASRVALSLVSYLLENEISTLNSLRASFGGGYEIVHTRDKSLAKLDGITYAFWSATFHSNADVQIAAWPHHVCSYKYHGDILVIRSISIDTSRDDNNITDDWLTVIDPIYRSSTEDERRQLPVPSLNNPLRCNVVMADGAKKRIARVIECQSDNSHALCFKESAEREKNVSQILVPDSLKNFMQRLLTPNPIRTICIICPVTGKPTSTFRATDEQSFESLNMAGERFDCPHCGNMHVFDRYQAFLHGP